MSRDTLSDVLRGDPHLDWGARMAGIPFPVPVVVNGRSVCIPASDDAADVTIVCGFLGCALQPFNPLIAALPRLLHLPSAGQHAWIAAIARQAAEESLSRRPGGEAMLARMSEMMFVDLVGAPPMQYLAQWRMQAAARLLMESRATVAAIALGVGYESEAAFARAFKRAVGLPPAAWRRAREREGTSVGNEEPEPE